MVSLIVPLHSSTCPQDGELRKMFQRTLTKQGLKFKLSTKVVEGEVTDSSVKLTLEPSKGGDKEQLEADVVLVSAGALPFAATAVLTAICAATPRPEVMRVNCTKPLDLACCCCCCCCSLQDVGTC